MRLETPVIPPPPRGISATIPPPGFTQPPREETNITKPYSLFRGPFVTPQDLEPRLQWIFNFMTNNTKQDLAQFKETISKLDRRELKRMAFSMTSDSDYFMCIASNEQGSKRMQKLLGISDDMDTLFCTAIVRLFLTIMTDKHASYVAVHAMRVFDDVKKESMYELILHYVLHLACDKRGCVAFNEIITDLNHPYYINKILDVVAHNAVSLSNDAYGNFVIQHVLKLNDLYCTRHIAVRLCGHFVDLSFRKHGSYIVERLLEKEESKVLVVGELLECEGDRLMTLASSDYGNFVVAKTLEVTKEEKIRDYLFWGLVHKLTPFLPLLRRSRGSKIATILDSVC
ncbi:hypothetical protein AALP_AA8G389800 [Arabis alpina]|uniref:PUM-HD domain-containing protein n=1 Tax=Arabis alpina TaxID=50452 RepID=A0A087GC87_ARAAL|nr:hypothetical protein AALP_AA8G389800 [Arabis alpina]